MTLNLRSIMSIGIFVIICGLFDTENIQAVDLGGEELGITLDFTYGSKYFWHGIDVFNDRGSYQPAAVFNFRNFFGGVWGVWPVSSGFEVWRELDPFIGFTQSFFDDEVYALNTKFDYWYVSRPAMNSDRDVQQISGTVSMPNLLKIGPSALVPSYSLYHICDGIQKRNTINNGWFQTLGLSYDIPIPAVLPGQEKQALTISWDVNFNDGVFGGDSGLSHSTLKLSTVYLWKQMYFSPAIYHQWSFQDTVDREDDFYFSLSIGYRF